MAWHTVAIRDEPILLFFLPIFLSSNSFFLACFAQYFAQSCNIFLKVASYLIVLSCTYIPKCIQISFTAIARLIVNANCNVLIVLLEYIDLFQSK